jgi:hypothetical protein
VTDRTEEDEQIEAGADVAIPAGLKSTSASCTQPIWLSSSKSSFVTGHSLLVGGGFTAQ